MKNLAAAAYLWSMKHELIGTAVSVASLDHARCAEAARRVVQRDPRKTYTKFYSPFRSEIAMGRHFGLQAEVDAVRHVERSGNNELEREWDYDIVINGYKLDAKLTTPRPGGSGLTVTSMKPGIILVALEIDRFDEEGAEPRDLIFKLLGWILTDPANTEAFVDRGSYHLVPRRMLRPMHELDALVRA